MSSSRSIIELRLLADKLLDSGSLSESEACRLSELLENPTARKWFLDVVGQESLLEEIFAKHTASTAAQISAKKSGFSTFRWIVFGLAASVIFGLGLWAGVGGVFQKNPMPEFASAEPMPARITELVGVVWENSSPQPGLLGGGISPNRLAMKAGLAEITYGNGVRLTIEGPCDFSITSKNSAKLEHGKLVAFVPPGAEGFGVDYARGRVVDLGTEFAMDIAPSGLAEVGVFEGEVRVQRPGKTSLSLLENQAVEFPIASQDGDVEAVPLNRDKFIRRVPSRDFRWEVKATQTAQFSADISHLVWKPSKYLAIFKWGRGGGIAQIQNVRLLCDGKEVALDSHIGTTSFDQSKIEANVFELIVSKDASRRGLWVLEADISVVPGSAGSGAELLGVMQFEEGMVSNATAADFVGAWVYSYAGARYKRIFYADGRVELLRNGVPDKGGFKNAHWKVQNGQLIIHADNIKFSEKHVLRDRDTLIFVDSPYENAKREKTLQEK